MVSTEEYKAFIKIFTRDSYLAKDEKVWIE